MNGGSLNPILYCWKIEVKQAVKDTIRQEFNLLLFFYELDLVDQYDRMLEVLVNIAFKLEVFLIHVNISVGYVSLAIS